MQTRRNFLELSSLGFAATALAASGNSLAASNTVNRRIVLASHPVGKPTVENFRLEEVAIPALKEGQMLIRTEYLSLDPYMRGRMNAAEGYAASVALNNTMVGGTVGIIEESRNANFKVGSRVMAYSGWQSYEVSDGTGVSLLDPRINPPSYALGVLGMPGLTAYVGLLDLANPQPGETVVLAASTGAVGSVVGQIAKLKGWKSVV